MAVKHRPPVRKQVPKKEVKKSIDWINSLTEKQTYILLGSLIALLILVIFFDFIMGNRYYLFKDIGSDTLNISYPGYMHISRYLGTDGFPKWSFTQGMGQSIFPAGFGDPFSVMLYLIGNGNIAYGIILTELLKIILCCWFFFMFMKLLEMSKTAAIIGSVLFSLSGFMIVGGSWYMFSSEALYLSFLLFAFEKLYKQNSWAFFPVAITFIAIYQTFDVYLYGLFLIIYMLFRFLSSDTPRFKDFINLVLKMAGLAILGLLIGSVFVFANIQTMIDSPRVSGHSSYFQTLMSKPVLSLGPAMHYTTAIMRAFGNDMLGNGANFKGWYNYLEAPLFYIGLLPLLLFTQVFSFITKRKKIIYTIFLAIFFIPIIFPFLRNAFWVFTGDYYRGYSIFFSSVLLLFSLQVITELDKPQKLNLVALLVTLAGLLILLYYPYQYIDQIIKSDLRSVVTVFLVLYAFILLLFNFIKNRLALKIILMLLVCVEIVYMNGKTVRDRNSITKTEWEQRTGYNDYTREAVSYLHSIDKGFYRLNKDYSSGPAMHSSINDAQVQNYYGTPSYSSFNQKYYIRFLEETGVIKKGVEDQSRWASGLSTRPLLQMFGSIKYNLSKQPKSFFQQMGNDSINKFGDVKVLKNRYFIPLGFTYTSYIPFSLYQKLSMIQKDAGLLKAFVAEEPVSSAYRDLKEFTLNDTTKIMTFNEIALDVNARRQDTLQITHFSNNHIRGKISLKEKKLLFLSIPYDKGWKATIDDKPAVPQLCNIGFTGFLLDKGEHQVKLDFEVPHLAVSIWLSILGILVFLAMLLIKNRDYLIQKFRNNSD